MSTSSLPETPRQRNIAARIQLTQPTPACTACLSFRLAQNIFEAVMAQ
ncbi:MAG TPA: hypothetical protein VMU67_00625 [Steroidobacteraceae bacterium]|nr:hypothetical protein [Steroidobacteraceae bacterium]